MEDFRKLERIQIMLSFLDAQGVCTNDQESDRFIANFLVFMEQHCGALDMRKRCSLIYEFLSKVSLLSLDVALQSLVKEGLEAGQNSENCWIYPEYSSQREIERKLYGQKLRSQSRDEVVINLGAMQRANSTIEDFCRSYYMFHGLDESKAHSIFMFLPVLYFIESYIYQLDTANEKQLLLSEVASSENCLLKCSTSDPFEPVIHLLQQQGLITERIRTELYHGVEYWKLERKLCGQLTNKNTILTEDVMRAIQLKSFDYRVLNLLLYKLRGKPVNELHFEFLSVSEFLVEVADDLYDYEEDVIDNAFNILRMFVGIYGASKAPVMLAKCIAEAEEKYNYLLKNLDPELSFNCSRRYEEATREGSLMSGHVVGKWTIPSIILDEQLFRMQAGVIKGSSKSS